jgi:hypothetical protein
MGELSSRSDDRGGEKRRRCRRAHQGLVLQRRGNTPPVVGFAADTLPVEGRERAPEIEKGRVKS